MNIIIEGPDATGKTTLAENLRDRYGFEYLHSTASTPNTYKWHSDILKKHNVVCDRFFVGETIYPEIYGRDSKLTFSEMALLLEEMERNNDILILTHVSNLDAIKDRLIKRGELNYLGEIEEQNKLFIDRYEKYLKYYPNIILFDTSIYNNKIEVSYDKIYERIESSINFIYRNICKELIYNGNLENTTSNKGSTRELNNFTFTLNDINHNVITLDSRMDKNSIVYLAGELLWYWQARNDLSFINHFSSFWSKVSDDGVTSNSAYGYILKKKHGFDQIEKIIELLKKDKYSRRAVLNINVPNENVIETKDEMCTIALIPFIRDNKLHMTGIMRSNDINFGLTYDITYFTEIQKYIADRVGVEYGCYTHLAVSMHCYDKDYEKIKSIADGNLKDSDLHLDTKKLLENMDYLVNFVENRMSNKECFYNELLKLGIII